MSATDREYWRTRPHAPAADTLLCKGEQIRRGEARAFAFGRGRSAFSMFVVRADAGFHAYLNLCPHFSLPLNHEPDGFMAGSFIECVQHFAQFRVEDGLCIAGACVGSHLDAVPVRLDANGDLRIG